MIHGLIFDFDGLILDTEGPIYQSWVELFAQCGVDLPFELWATIIGVSANEHFDPMDLLEKRVGVLAERQKLAGRRLERELELVMAETVLPGVIELLTAARAAGLRLGVASSSSRRWVVGHLERLGLLDYFEVVCTADEVERAKPDPALFELALRELGLQPSEAIALEDSPNGAMAARRAGIFVAAVPNRLTARLDLSHADLRLESLAGVSLAGLIGAAQNQRGSNPA